MAFLAPIVIPLLVGSAIVGGVAAIQQGRFQAKVAKQNAALARAAGEKNAKLAIAQSRAEEVRRRRLGVQQLGRARAFIGARGLLVEGSPLDFLAEQAAVIEEESLLIRFGGKLRAQSLLFGAALESRRQEAFGTLARSRGISQGIASFGQAFGFASLLGPGGGGTAPVVGNIGGPGGGPSFGGVAFA